MSDPISLPTVGSVSVPGSVSVSEADDGYPAFAAHVAKKIANNREPLFETSLSPDAIWDAYLQNLPDPQRKHYECRACRKFLGTYGGLARIDPKTGGLVPLLWDAAMEPGDPVEGWGRPCVPSFFAPAFEALARLVSRSSIAGVFYPAESTWGTPKTTRKKDGRVWSHLSGQPTLSVRLRAGQEPHQAAAERLEEFGMLQRALADYPKPVVEEALRVLRSDALARSEKALGVAEWFLARQGERRSPGLLWLAVATAPIGYAHVRTTVISTLLDDVASGADFEAIRKRWAEKIDPLAYQRPTAAPREGQVEAAERLVEKLGIAPSLRRRRAALDDVLVKIWVPRPPEEPARPEGVFGHLRPGAARPPEVALPPTRITWEKFARTALASARSLEVRTPPHGNYCGIVTASDPEAPPILQWDGLEGQERNPVSHYVYHGGSPRSDWGLSGDWAPVRALFLSAHLWQEPEKFDHHGRNLHVAIEGAQDRRNTSLALFPETMRAELHGARSVVEAHSRSGRLDPLPEGSIGADGLAWNEKGEALEVRVDGRDVYVLDRWD